MNRIRRSSRRQRGLIWALTAIVVILGAGDLCGGSVASAHRGSPEFYVSSHGWHTSIIVSRRDIPAGAWPRRVANETFSGFEFLEVGWGDRKFYTAPKPNAAMALDAVLSPGPSVLHVVGLNAPIQTALPWSALVRVSATRENLARLCRALGESFEPDSTGAAVAVGKGLYGKTSWFYAARGRYYLFNTCDTWTARMMRAGGLPADTSVAGTWSAGAVIAQARRLVAGRAEQKRERRHRASRE
ncbi:MAG: DUF2459 domain-containing protein [Verrucomicrobiota bacterium]|nr:DUF2459 domain-containing protein [Verrucomicrobiota bacterium]